MARFLSIILIGLFCKISILEPSTLVANNVSFSSIYVEGNKRISTKQSLIIQD